MLMVSEYGNEVVVTDNPIKIEHLKELGFKEVKKPSKKGKNKNGNQKEAESDI